MALQDPPAGSSTARKTFEIHNDVRVREERRLVSLLLRGSCIHLLQTVDPTDALFQYSRDDERILEDQAPWKNE